jgi:hypothetical protein
MAKKTSLKKAEEVSKNLQIRNIHLAASNCRRDLSFKPKQANVDINIEVKSLNSTNKKLLPFVCRFLLTGVDIEENKESFKLDITFVAAYNIKPGYKPSKTEKEAFGITNAVFNVWPYLREHVQNMMIKMDLTAFVLPPMTIGDLSKMKKQPDKTIQT